MMGYCKSSPQGRRRPFWTTQPDACGTRVDSCRNGAECGIPGLQLTASSCGRFACDCCPAPTDDPDCIGINSPPVARSIVTNDWLRSLVINILHTDGRYEDNKCGFVPGTQGGHWSESFRKDGQKIGTLMRTIPPHTSIRDAISLVKARMVADLNRLLVMQLVTSIAVNVRYLGGSQVTVEIIIIGQSGETAKVGLLGSRLKNTWVWS